MMKFLQSLILLYKPEEFKNHFVIPIAIIAQCIIIYISSYFLNTLNNSDSDLINNIYIYILVFTCLYWLLSTFYFLYHLFKYKGNEWLKFAYLLFYIVGFIFFFIISLE